MNERSTCGFVLKVTTNLLNMNSCNCFAYETRSSAWAITMFSNLKPRTGNAAENPETSYFLRRSTVIGVRCCLRAAQLPQWSLSLIIQLFALKLRWCRFSLTFSHTKENATLLMSSMQLSPALSGNLCPLPGVKIGREQLFAKFPIT